MKKLLYIFMLTKDDIGPKEHVRNILKYTSCNVEVVTNHEDKIWDKFLQKCIKYKFNNTMLNILVFQAAAAIYIIKNRKIYKMIFLRQSVGFFLIPVVAKILKIKIAIEVNGFQYQDLLDRDKIVFAKVNKFLEKITFSCADKIICVHENIKKNLISNFKDLNKNPNKIVVVENGIEVTEYKSVKELKGKNNISQDEFRIGYLGSYAHREGVDYLPQIAQKLSAENIKFVLIGGAENNVKNFQQVIELLHVEKLFELTPYLPLSKAIDRLKTCDICIHLRRPIDGSVNSQGSPLKMLDYHNIGRYVIASDIDSYQYIYKNNFGVLVNLNKESFIDDVVKIIKDLKGKDSIEFNGKRAYEYIQTKTWKNQISKLDIELERI